MFMYCSHNLTKSECRLIVLIGDVSKLKDHWSVSIIEVTFFLELFVILIGLLCSTVAINVFVRSSAIHLNFSRIVIAFTANFYILAISRILLMIFEIGYLDLEAKENSGLLLIATILLIHQTGSSVNYFFGLIVERTFATIFIKDYELREMANVSTILLILGNSECLLLTIALSIGIFANVLEILAILSVVLLVMILAGVIISIYIYRANKSYYENAQKRFASSLSTKFQLAENFRVFRVLIYFAINFGIAASTASVFLQLSFYYLDKDDNLNSLYSALFNLHYTISMVVLNATFVLSLPPWKRDFHQIMCRFLPFIPAPPSLVTVIKHEKEVGDHYFNDLIGSWDNRLTVNKRR